jgi:hypothetical protein
MTHRANFSLIMKHKKLMFKPLNGPETPSTHRLVHEFFLFADSYRQKANQLAQMARESL